MTPPTRPVVLLDRAGPGLWRVRPLTAPDGVLRDTAAPDAALAALVAGFEAARSPRWVVEATASVYPSLVAAGVRLGRAHDLHAVERLLLGREGRWAELSALADPAPAPSAPSELLFDDPDDAAPAGAPAAPADPATRYAAQQERLRRHDPGLTLLAAAESAGWLAATEMAARGLPWDVAVHDAVLTEALGPRPRHGRPALLQQLATDLAEALDDPRLNPDSQPDLLRSLRRAGLPVTSTGRHELARHEHPAIPLVRRYKELARLWTANGWAWADTWVREGRFHPEYCPGGVVSGRWATKGGGALQIPRAVRAAVRAPEGRVLVVADAGQLEPRVLAALSADPGMVAATRAGDLYAELAARALGRPDARAEAKLALLSAMYGGGTGSPALAALRRRFPRALTLLEDAARLGEEGGGPVSVLGRACPPARPGWLDGLADAAAGARMRARGRFTRNYLVQASAADWAAVLVAGLRARLAALPVGADGHPAELVFFQHDEVVVEASAERADDVVAAIADAGHDATARVLGDTGVQVPLDAAVVASYADKP